MKSPQGRRKGTIMQTFVKVNSEQYGIDAIVVIAWNLMSAGADFEEMRKSIPYYKGLAWIGVMTSLEFVADFGDDEQPTNIRLINATAPVSDVLAADAPVGAFDWRIVGSARRVFRRDERGVIVGFDYVE